MRNICQALLYKVWLFFYVLFAQILYWGNGFPLLPMKFDPAQLP